MDHLFNAGEELAFRVGYDDVNETLCNQHLVHGACSGLVIFFRLHCLLMLTGRCATSTSCTLRCLVLTFCVQMVVIRRIASSISCTLQFSMLTSETVRRYAAAAGRQCRSAEARRDQLGLRRHAAPGLSARGAGGRRHGDVQPSARRQLLELTGELCLWNPVYVFELV